MLDVFKQHKVSKVLFSVLSLLMLTISTLIAPIFAHAQEGDPNVVQRASGDWTQMWHEKYQNKGWAKDLNTGYDIETDVIKFGDGSIAYCLEMMLESPDGHSLEEKARLSDEYYKIMNSGYPVKSPAELGASSWQVAHYATQLAVWVTNTDISYDKLQFNNAEVKRVLDKILADSRVSDATQDLTFELTPDHIVAENPPWGNNVKQAGPFTIKTNGEGTFSVEAINAPNPVTFVNNVGEPMTTFKPGDRFYAQVSSDAPTGNFNIRATGNLTKTETLWYKSHNAGIQHTTAIVTLHKTPVAENASVSWDSNGGFEVVKTDENGKVLGGAEFEVTNANGNVVKTFTTDSNGKATITGLDFGEYTVKETKAPNGYTMDATPQKVTVDSKQKSVTFVNKQEKGSIKITKVDDANKPLAGVQFAVYNSKGNMVKTVTTDANGVATVGNLPFDTYTWKETKGLPGYDTVNKTGSFEVNSATKDHEVKVENKKLKGGLHITKVDDKDKPLKGVEFTVYKDGKEVAKATTDANGNVSFDNLETGKYTYKETKGLDGYVSDKTEKPFELTTTNLLHQAKVVNKLISGSLEITKTDDANKPLEGVEFTVFKDGKEFKKVTTDANGKIVLTDLPMGKYTYKETKGLAGYVADTQERAFEVKDLGDTHKATVVNKLIKGSIEITKTDDSNKPLAGVEFTVYKDGKEYTKVTTNDKGIAEVKDLPYGEYTFKETKGIEGYVSDSTTQLVDIKKDGQTDKFTVVNKKIKGSLEIVKTDDAKKPLKGVEFTVYDAKDKEITKVVTDDKGKASVKDLPYGKYYFKETKGLEGYVYDKSNVEFEIKNLNETKSYTVVNKLIRSNIEITKVDNEGKLLEGVEFTIYDSNDKEVAKVVTDAQGKAKYDNLPYGKYYFKETKNLEGYVENGKKYDFDVKQDLQTLKFDVINKKIRGSVEVLKVDADKQEKPLAGVEFTLFDQNNKVIGKPKVTDKDGKVSFDNIAFGKYYIKETKTIEGYNINDEKFPVDIDKDGKVVKHTVTNKVIRGNVELLKVDTENKDAKLEGAEFELRGSNDEILGKYTTDKDGKLVIKDLVFGSYKLIETKAPTGFVLDQTPKEFTISEEGKTINVTKENTKIYGDLEVTKVDTADSKTKLANAKFEVYNEKGEKVAEGVTDEKGVASFKHLVYGKYTFKEVVAPEGYFVNETVFNFEVLENGKVISKKVEDEKVPAIKTTATDKHDGKKEMHTSKKVTIQDKVEYKDLLVGKEYTVKGKLMDKSTGKPLVVDGKEVKAEATFTPKQPTGSITLDFTFDATGLEEKEVVVFEDLIKEGKVVTTHSDLEDKDQTVKFVKPDIKTTATDKADGSKELHAIKKVTIQDVVSYNNLVVGKEYVLKGKLMDKATNKPLKVNGKEVTAETKFSPREANGSVPLNFTLDASELAGKEVVVFESVEHNGFEVAVHADIKDLGQTVKFEKPTVKTTATFKEDGGKEIHAKESITIQDVVEYTNLVVGKEYTVKGKLMNKVTNEVFLDADGKEVTAETTFTAKEKNGSVTLDFTFNGVENQGREVVVFEDLLHKGDKIATHSDIEDKGQTVKFVEPTIHTTATNKADEGKELHANQTVTIQDKVEYKDLIVGKEYTVKGKLMDKETNKPLLVNDKEVTAETKFKAETKDGSIVLDFTFDAKGLEGKDVVVFEEMYKDELLIAVHTDIEDEGQTVTFVKPDVKTTATNKEDGMKEIHSNKTVTIQDKVKYNNLIIGKEYTVKGKLMDKETNKPFLVDGKEVTSETKFTAEKKDGSVTLDFTFEAKGVEGKEVVVFEDLYNGDVLVATHADINDKDQTVKFVKPEVKTTATNKADGSKELDADKKVTISDKVEYKDLIVGKEYVVKGKLMDKATNKPLIINGKEVTSETKFTAEKKDGSVVLDFTFDATELQGKEVVVFEDLYQGDILVATHSDINDAGQTVKFKVKPVTPDQPKPEQPKPEKPSKPEQPKPGKPVPQTGNAGDFGTTIISLVAVIALAIAGVFVFTRKRKAE